MMSYGHKLNRTGIAIIAVLLACIMSVGAYAISPEQYRSILETNVKAYSSTKDWQRVAVQLCADETDIRDGDGVFAITDENGNDLLTTGAAQLNISGSVSDGNVVSISISLKPMDGLTREYEYQAFSISEIAFESLLNSRAANSDMSAYLFLYDIYPYAMWARDSEFGDNTRSFETALGGVCYAIKSISSANEKTITLSVEIKGDADDSDETEARNNLNANYALESICSLVYELDVCKSNCLTLIKRDDDSDMLESLLGDMRSCAEDYYALDAQDYPKLSVLTGQLDTEFDNMLSAIDSLEDGKSDEAANALDASVTNMCTALKIMY